MCLFVVSRLCVKQKYQLIKFRVIIMKWSLPVDQRATVCNWQKPLCMCGSCVFEARFPVHIVCFHACFWCILMRFAFLGCVNVVRRSCLLSCKKPHQKMHVHVFSMSFWCDLIEVYEAKNAPGVLRVKKSVRRSKKCTGGNCIDVNVTHRN